MSSVLKVSDLMSEALEWTSVNESCVDAAQRMIKKTVGALPVRDEKGQLSGIVTDRDIVTRVVATGLNASRAKVSTAMTSLPLISVLDTDIIETAKKAMVRGDVRRLIVRNSANTNQIVGILTVDDLARAGMKKMAGEVIRETAILHRERQAIPTITVSGDLAGGADISASSVENSVSLAVNRLVEWIDANDTVRTAAHKMSHRNIGCLPVCADGKVGRLSGLLTDRDIIIRVVAAERNPDETRVRDVMSCDLVWCFLDDKIKDAQQLMIEKGVRRLPVLLRSTRELVGVLSVDDVALWASQSRAGAVVRAAVELSAPAEYPKASAAFQPDIA